MPVMVAIRLVYTTCPDVEAARTLARHMVESGLVACANILPGMWACYRWQGAVEESDEVVVILKTTQAQAQTVVERVVAEHPYEVPCALILPVDGGHPAYLEWLAGAP